MGVPTDLSTNSQELLMKAAAGKNPLPADKKDDAPPDGFNTLPVQYFQSFSPEGHM